MQAYKPENLPEQYVNRASGESSKVFMQTKHEFLVSLQAMSQKQLGLYGIYPSSLLA